MSISITRVGLVRDEEVWLEDVELEVLDGELTHLIGPPGAGKTSLLRLIAGRFRPSTGRVRGARPRDVVLVEANPDARHRRPLGRRLAIAASRGRGAHGSDPDAVVSALELGAAVGQAVPAMPPALALRAALAEAIIAAPAVLLLDEPWGHMPAIAARRLREAVRPFLEARAGVTVIAATSGESVLSLDGAAAVMSMGRVVQRGALADLVAAPRSVRAVPCHLPRLNLADVTLRDQTLVFASRLTLPATGALADLTAGRYTLGVAADRLSLTPFDGALAIPAIVTLVEVDGGLRRLVAEVGQDVWHLVLPEAIGLAPGEHVTFQVDPADVVVFGDTGVLEWRAGDPCAKTGEGRWMARIELESISVVTSPDGTTAGPLDLVVDEGGCLAFLGPDPQQGGAILRVAAGAARPHGGRVIVDGDPLDSRLPPPAQIGFGFAPPFAYEHLSVARNLELATAASIEAGAAISRVAGLFELQPWLETRGRDLSGDVLAIVDVCRALVKPPPAIVFLDHPFAGLGAERRRWAWARLARWRQLERPAMVIATDDAGLALSLADQIVALRDGAVIQVGTPADLIDRPVDLDLALATGSLGMNRLPCAVEPDALMIIGTDFGLAGEWLAAARAATGRVELGIRPEHVQLAPDPLEWTMPAAILRHDLCAYGLLLTADLAEHTVVALAPSTMPPLDEIHLYLPPERLSLFADGRRIR